MKRTSVFIPVILILVGVVLISFIVIRNTKEKEVFPEAFFEEGANVEWMGIYLKGYKVGYVASRIDSTDKGYRVYSNTYMKMSPVAGLQREVSYRVVANTSSDYNLLDFYFQMVSGEHLFTASGERKGDKMIVSMDVAGNTSRMEFPLTSEYIPATIEGMVKMGKTGSFQFFDPTLQSVFDITVKKIGPDTLEGVPAVKYSVQQSGIYVSFWVDKDGHLLRQESPIGLVMKRESSDVVTDIGEVSFKLYDSYAIRVDKPIENPRTLNSLTIRLDSVDLEGLRIEDDRQKLSGNVLVIKRLEPGDSKIIPEEVKSFLEPTPFEPSDDELIKKTAMKVIGDKEGWEAARRIITFVDTTLKDSPTFSIPNALDALKSREGDCNEHSALAVALLRACGIPARLEVGIVYVAGAFYYHAWIGVYVGGKWISADPTFGQVVADPTHVKLEYGGFEEQAKLYRVINKLRVSVLQYD